MNMNRIYVCYYTLEHEGEFIDFATTDKDKAFDTDRVNDKTKYFNTYAGARPGIEVYNLDGTMVEEYLYKRDSDEWIKLGED